MGRERRKEKRENGLVGLMGRERDSNSGLLSSEVLEELTECFLMCRNELLLHVQP